MVKTGVDHIQSKEEMSPEERAFQDRVDADIKIEPKEWMPEAYRKTLIRQISQHAHSRSSACSRRATGSPAPRPSSARPSCSPRCRTRRATAYLYCAAETLGVSRDELLEQLQQRQGQVFEHLQLSDPDLGRYRGHRLARGRRRDHEPGAAAALLLRSLFPRHDPHLQGRKLPPAAGL